MTRRGSNFKSNCHNIGHTLECSSKVVVKLPSRLKWNTTGRPRLWIDLKEGFLPPIRTLGVLWQAAEDEFSFKVRPPDDYLSFVKRNFLSEVDFIRSTRVPCAIFLTEPNSYCKTYRSQGWTGMIPSEKPWFAEVANDLLHFTGQDFTAAQRERAQEDFKVLFEGAPPLSSVMSKLCLLFRPNVAWTNGTNLSLIDEVAMIKWVTWENYISQTSSVTYVFYCTFQVTTIWRTMEKKLNKILRQLLLLRNHLNVVVGLFLA